MLAIIMKGLCGSGKSTWSSQQEGFIIISKDKIRKAYPELNEQLVDELQTKLIKDAKTDIIIDNTHMNKSTLQRTTDLCKKLGYEVEVKDMYDVMKEWKNERQYLGVCIERNSEREVPVPECVIDEMYLKNYKLNRNYYIFDIDGTLAKMHPERREAIERKDYIAFYSDLVLKDEPIEQTINLLRTLNNTGAYIILMSGRSNQCCSDTIKRLSDNDISYDHLLMRQAGNHNQDSYIKSRLFDECLGRQDAKCLGVFDDRKSVKRMRVGKGLFVFDVNQTDEDF